MPGIRPPIIAAGINLFGGPLGLIHKHVTGALPIRRNTKDPAYLITLKAYVGTLLHKHDLFFYPEGGRSYSGELKSPKTGLFSACLSANVPTWSIVPIAVAYDLVLEDHILARQRVKRAPAGRSAASWRRWCATPSAIAAARSSPSAGRSRSTATTPNRGARCSIWRTWCSARSGGSTRCCRRRCSPRRCGRRSRGPISRDRIAAILDTLRATGANLAVHDRRRGAGRRHRAVRDARHHRRRETARFRVRERHVLRYYGRSLQHLLSPAGATH